MQQLQTTLRVTAAGSGAFGPCPEIESRAVALQQQQQPVRTRVTDVDVQVYHGRSQQGNKTCVGAGGEDRRSSAGHLYGSAPSLLACRGSLIRQKLHSVPLKLQQNLKLFCRRWHAPTYCAFVCKRRGV